MTLKEAIIDAFRKGRVAGATFKRAKDSEGLAEKYYKEFKEKHLKDGY